MPDDDQGTPQTPLETSIDGPEHGLRDLMSLLALPALWAGRDGAAIIDLMIQAIESVVPLQITYVELPLLQDRPPFIRLRLCRADVSRAETEAWRNTIGHWHTLPIGTRMVICETPAGPMRMIRLSMGFSSGEGSIWFGADAAGFPAFPTVNQIALLRAATSLAATGIVTARAAHEREEANRSKDEFLAMLGHELRNPLAPITASLALIRRERGNLPHRYHDIIERQVAHLSRLVEDLLDVTRITRGKVVLQREPIRADAMIMRAVEAVSPLIELRRQRLYVDLMNDMDNADDGVLVYGDPTRLTQAFSNLLNNAAKYTQDGGQIRITASVDGTILKVSITDNGAGFGSELMPKLFSIFEQGRVTIARSDGGLGIGLALVKNFVELHGGTVYAKSDGPGMGATFTVTLPVATQAEIASALSMQARPAQDTVLDEVVRVLLVDDNADGLSSMEAFLCEMGFAVATATDAAQALDIADRFSPHVAVLDIGLPGMNGYELAVALRSQPHHGDVRLFALTGYSQPDDLKRSTNAGFERHFVKPVPLFDLVDALNGRI